MATYCCERLGTTARRCYAGSSKSFTESTFSLFQLRRHSCSENTSNVPRAARESCFPRVLVYIMGLGCFSWVLLSAEQDPSMHIFQEVLVWGEQTYAWKNVCAGHIHVSSFCARKKLELAILTDSSLYTSLAFLLCNVTVLTIPHPCVPAVFRHRQQRDRSRTCNAEDCLCTHTASWRGSC